jgi:hypothetical protein
MCDRLLAATSLKELQGKIQFAFLPPFPAALMATLMATLMEAPPKDLAVGHALAEIVEGDAAHGAELRD